MNKFFVVLTYILWIVAIVTVVAATLSDFKWEDLNILALVTLAGALLNSFFMMAKK